MLRQAANCEWPQWQQWRRVTAPNGSYTCHNWQCSPPCVDTVGCCAANGNGTRAARGPLLSSNAMTACVLCTVAHAVPDGVTTNLFFALWNLQITLHLNHSRRRPVYRSCRVVTAYASTATSRCLRRPSRRSARTRAIVAPVRGSKRSVNAAKMSCKCELIDSVVIMPMMPDDDVTNMRS